MESGKVLASIVDKIGSKVDGIANLVKDMHESIETLNVVIGYVNIKKDAMTYDGKDELIDDLVVCAEEVLELEKEVRRFRNNIVNIAKNSKYKMRANLTQKSDKIKGGIISNEAQDRVCIQQQQQLFYCY